MCFLKGAKRVSVQRWEMDKNDRLLTVFPMFSQGVVLLEGYEGPRLFTAVYGRIRRHIGMLVDRDYGKTPMSRWLYGQMNDDDVLRDMLSGATDIRSAIEQTDQLYEVTFLQHATEVPIIVARDFTRLPNNYLPEAGFRLPPIVTPVSLPMTSEPKNHEG